MSWWEKIHVANFLQNLPCKKNAVNFLTKAVFPYGNFLLDLWQGQRQKPSETNHVFSCLIWCLVGPTTKTKSKRCSTSLTRIRTGENHCFFTIISIRIIPAMSIISMIIFPILIITRFISSVELGKVMADLGERLSEEEVSSSNIRCHRFKKY